MPRSPSDAPLDGESALTRQQAERLAAGKDASEKQRDLVSHLLDRSRADLVQLREQLARNAAEITSRPPFASQKSALDEVIALTASSGLSASFKAYVHAFVGAHPQEAGLAIAEKAREDKIALPSAVQESLDRAVMDPHEYGLATLTLTYAQFLHPGATALHAYLDSHLPDAVNTGRFTTLPPELAQYRGTLVLLEHMIAQSRGETPPIERNGKTTIYAALDSTFAAIRRNLKSAETNLRLDRYASAEAPLESALVQLLADRRLAQAALYGLSVSALAQGKLDTARGYERMLSSAYDAKDWEGHQAELDDLRAKLYPTPRSPQHPQSDSR